MVDFAYGFWKETDLFDISDISFTWIANLESIVVNQVAGVRLTESLVVKGMLLNRVGSTRYCLQYERKRLKEIEIS